MRNLFPLKFYLSRTFDLIITSERYRRNNGNFTWQVRFLLFDVTSGTWRDTLNRELSQRPKPPQEVLRRRWWRHRRSGDGHELPLDSHGDRLAKKEEAYTRHPSIPPYFGTLRKKKGSHLPRSLERLVLFISRTPPVVRSGTSHKKLNFIWPKNLMITPWSDAQGTLPNLTLGSLAESNLTYAVAFRSSVL